MGWSIINLQNKLNKASQMRRTKLSRVPFLLRISPHSIQEVWSERERIADTAC